MGPNHDRSVLIVDSFPLYVDALDRLLAGVGMTVVGTTTSPSAALAMVRELQPDLLVAGMEVVDENLDGLGLIREVNTAAPDMKIVVVSEVADRQVAVAALSAGASAYVIKTAHPDDLTSAVRQAFDHSLYLASPHLTVVPDAPAEDDSEHRLTPRELEILRLAAEGYSNGEMARMLWVTEQTIKFHLSNVYRKLKVANRTEASRWAQIHGLLSDSPLKAI